MLPRSLAIYTWAHTSLISLFYLPISIVYLGAVVYILRHFLTGPESFNARCLLMPGCCYDVGSAKSVLKKLLINIGLPAVLIVT